MIPVKTRSEIVNEAASWEGTPWAHMQAAKGSGADCIGIIRGLYGFVYGTEIPLCDYYYTPSWFHPPTKHSLLLSALSSRLNEIALSEAQAGDVIAFDRYRVGVPTHCGVLLQENNFVHVDSRKGAIVAPYRTPWTDKTYACFSFFPSEV